jgi:hypothetical protein
VKQNIVKKKERKSERKKERKKEKEVESSHKIIAKFKKQLHSIYEIDLKHKKANNATTL